MATGSPVLRFVSIAYWSTAESIMRKSLRIRLAWERLRARKNPGTAIAARRAIMATTIMISTRVKPLGDFAADVFIYIEGLATGMPMHRRSIVNKAKSDRRQNAAT